MNKLMILGLILSSISSYSQFMPIPDIDKDSQLWLELESIEGKIESATGDVSRVNNNIDSLSNSLTRVAFTGDYNDLSDKPVNISYFTNDANYITIDYANETYLPVIGGILTGGLYINSGGISTSNILSVGTGNIVSGNGAVVFGNTSKATSSSFSHGYLTESTANNAHAEGQGSKASGARSHAEGYYTISSGAGSHSIGNNTESRGSYSFAGGYNSLSSNQYSWVWSGVLPTTIYNNEDELDYNVYSNDIHRLLINPYTSHGSGTFNINPIGGINGFYVGDTTLGNIIESSSTSTVDKIYINLTNNLSKVAFTSDYNDLINVPELPSSNVPTYLKLNSVTITNTIDGESIVLSIDIPVYWFNKSGESGYYFNDFSTIPTTNSIPDGIYTWELFIKTTTSTFTVDVDPTIFWVDKTSALSSENLNKNIHVFTIRLVKKDDDYTWMLNYSYSY